MGGLVAVMAGMGGCAKEGDTCQREVHADHDTCGNRKGLTFIDPSHRKTY